MRLNCIRRYKWAFIDEYDDIEQLPVGHPNFLKFTAACSAIQQVRLCAFGSVLGVDGLMVFGGTRIVITRPWDRFSSLACSWRSWLLLRGSGQDLGSRSASRCVSLGGSAFGITHAVAVRTVPTRRMSESGDASRVHVRGKRVGHVRIDLGSRRPSLVSVH